MLHTHAHAHTAYSLALFVVVRRSYELSDGVQRRAFVLRFNQLTTPVFVKAIDRDLGTNYPFTLTIKKPEKLSPMDFLRPRLLFSAGISPDNIDRAPWRCLDHHRVATQIQRATTRLLRRHLQWIVIEMYDH